MKIKFCTDEYYRTYGCQPRGYGNWRFEVKNPSGIGYVLFGAYGALPDCKKRVVVDVKAMYKSAGVNGDISIDILP